MGRNYPPNVTSALPGLGATKLFNGLRDQTAGGQDSGSWDFGARSDHKSRSRHVFGDLGRKTFFKLMGSHKSHQKLVGNNCDGVDNETFVSNIRRPQRSF